MLNANDNKYYSYSEYHLISPSSKQELQVNKTGVWLYLLIGFFVTALAGIFAFLGEETARSALLGVLGIFSILGIFVSLAAAAGLVRIGGTPRVQHHEYPFLESLDGAHTITNRQGQLIFADTAYAQLIGAVTTQDIRSVERVFGTQEGLSEPIYRLSIAASEGRAANEEMRIERAIGEEDAEMFIPRWFRISVRPVCSSDGGELDIEAKTIWRVEDITSDREDQEFAFQELQNVINYLEHAPAGFFSADRDGNISYLNATLAGWLGLDQSKFRPGRIHLRNLVRGDGAALLNAAQAGPGEVHEETIDLDFVKLGGRSLPVRLLHLTPFKEDGAPGPTRTIVLNRSNITEADDISYETNAKFQRFFSAAPIAIAGLDRSGRISRANATFIRQFNLVCSQNKKTRLRDLFAETDQDKLSDAIDLAMAQQSEIPPVDAALAKNENDSATLYLSSVSVMADAEHDNQEVAVVYAIDTTKQRAFEQQFAQGQKMQAIGQLAGGIAHDFNNMLTAIIGFSDLMLQNHGPSDPSFQDIMNIKNNANRAAGLVRQLLAFSRRQTLRPKVIDLRDVIEDLSILLERLLGENVRLSISHRRDLWALKADLNQLEQVIINLAVNARDAMPDGGDLKISTRNLTPDECDPLEMAGVVPGEYVLIEVTDTGTGMTEEVMAKIFEPFFSTKDVGKGTGLGLATVYGIIKQTGGFVYPVSKLGVGTTFKILLPRHIAEEVEEEVQVVEAPRDLSGSANILLVEDEEAVRAFSARALEARGYTVHQASSGVSALELMKEMEDSVDLVVSDVVMPEMDGPTLLAELRKMHPNLKIIFVSGYAEEAFEKHLAKGEKFHFLPKPFSLKQLATKVKEVLDGAEAS